MPDPAHDKTLLDIHDRVAWLRKWRTSMMPEKKPDGTYEASIGVWFLINALEFNIRRLEHDIQDRLTGKS